MRLFLIVATVTPVRSIQGGQNATTQSSLSFVLFGWSRCFPLEALEFYLLSPSLMSRRFPLRIEGKPLSCRNLFRMLVFVLTMHRVRPMRSPCNWPPGVRLTTKQTVFLPPFFHLATLITSLLNKANSNTQKSWNPARVEKQESSS